MSRFDTKGMGDELVAALERLRPLALATGDQADAAALEWLETFGAVALRVLGKANPSKVRAEAVAVDIQSRIAPSARVTKG